MAFKALENADQRAAFFICVFATPVCIFLTTLRFTTTRRAGRKIGIEDWFALVSLFFYLVWVAFALASVILENGRNVLELGSLPKSTTLGLIKSGYIVNAVYPINQTFAKLSLLILYYRIFSASQGFVRLAWIVAIVQILWFVPNFVERLLVCNPPAKLWDPKIPGFCVNSSAFVAATESVNSLIDFIMIGMAVWMVQHLKVATKTKVQLTVVFALGGFSGIVGIIKIIQVYGKVDVNGTDLPWLLIQMATTVICCSVPLYRSLLSDFGILSSLKSTFFSSRGSDGWQQGSSNFAPGTSLQTIGQKSSNNHIRNDSWVGTNGEWAALGDSSSTRELSSRAWADTESARSATTEHAAPSKTLKFEQLVERRD